jgi:quercetin dioxygenase-like cupin family protein
MTEQSPIAMVEPLTHGLMADFTGTSHPSMVYAMTGGTLLIDKSPLGEFDSAYGVVYEGSVEVSIGERRFTVGPGEYFSVPFEKAFLAEGISGDGKGKAKMLVAVRLGYKSLLNIGGPVEPFGRLKYIDGCSDTLLIGPPLKGDPCLNMLRFPKGIDQTAHTHPTIRAGVILSGEGVCRTAHGDKKLVPGSAFILYPDAIHAFSTLDTDGMALSVFHPDTDTGPSHEDHPMLNRTIVDGVSAKNLDDIRTKELEG